MKNKTPFGLISVVLLVVAAPLSAQKAARSFGLEAVSPRFWELVDPTKNKSGTGA